MVSPESRLCPPGWAGVVSLGGGTLVTVPEAGLAGRFTEPMPDLAALARDAREALGPAVLAYLDEADFVPAHAGAESLPPGHGDVMALLAGVSEADARECGLDEVTSSVYVLRDGHEVVAASAYTAWPESTAHVSLLTAATHRGRGLARVVASAAVADALARGLLPQWRARPEASRRVARALGFREHGGQLSVHLAPDGPGARLSARLTSGGPGAVSADQSSVDGGSA
ncbi:GNAT family N-acetyltransferase [Nonomuraea sp. NPDC050404]|uniref:GNAT family N-acetyltransferase n=1 Tax=Nonomuraea sp. NPDC050404 TaxID=3155783 RepID=UPI0033C14037